MKRSPRSVNHVVCKDADPSALLSASSAHTILARIVPGDPLRLRMRVAQCLRRRHLLCDGDHVHLRVLARCARLAPGAGALHPLEEWIDAQVDVAIAEIVDELDRAHEARADSAYVDFAQPLGLDARRVQALCAALNALPDEERRAFIALVLEVRESPGEGSAEASAAVGPARRALAALLVRSEPAER